MLDLPMPMHLLGLPLSCEQPREMATPPGPFLRSFHPAEGLLVSVAWEVNLPTSPPTARTRPKAKAPSPKAVFPHTFGK